MSPRRTFVERLVVFGRALTPDAVHEAQARRDYVQALVALSASLNPQPSTENQLERFRTRVMPRVQTIMRTVAGAQAIRRRELDWQRRAAVDALGDAVELLPLLRLERDEVTHTRLIAAFLDTSTGCRFPELSGECGRRLEALLRRKDAGLSQVGLALERAQAQAERVLPGGRVDISLESDSAVLFLEAKIDSEERPGQLDDYHKALHSTADSRTRVLVFLTARDDHESSSKVPHVHVSFGDLLRAWLPVVLQLDPARGELRRYLKTVAAGVVGVAAPGPFELWPVSTQRACLDFLEQEDFDHDA